MKLWDMYFFKDKWMNNFLNVKSNKIKFILRGQRIKKNKQKHIYFIKFETDLETVIRYELGCIWLRGQTVFQKWHPPSNWHKNSTKTDTPFKI